jgi:tetrahydromethanopterin S-methyltransferase subunit B
LAALDPFAALAGLALVGATLMGIGFLLRREAEEFYTDNRRDAASMRALFQGRFQQLFAEKVTATVTTAAAGATTIQVKELKEKIADAALEPTQESWAKDLSESLASRDEVWTVFNDARKTKVTLGGWLIGLGVLLVVASLYFVTPDPFSAPQSFVFGLVIGIVAYLISLQAAGEYSKQSKASGKFYEYCEKELKTL